MNRHAILILTFALAAAPFTAPAGATHAGDTLCTIDTSAGITSCTFSCHQHDRIYAVITPTAGDFRVYGECGDAYIDWTCSSPCTDKSTTGASSHDTGICTTYQGSGSATCHAAPDSAACNDKLDNDGDGVFDYPADPGCFGPGDESERGSLVCDDGLDNDGDTVQDHPADTGCSGPSDPSERGTLACDDGLDNDADGKSDFPSDPGCGSHADPSEHGAAACDDGLDNDGDGRTDHGADPGCASLTDASERGSAACDDGADNDLDGASDYPSDPGCASPTDASERGSAACDDGADNDNDGRTDFPSDPGCTDPTDSTEGGACGETAPGVILCLTPGNEFVVQQAYVAGIGQGPMHTLVGHVELYRFVVAGVAFTIPCVRLVADGTESDPCGVAGGTYVSTVADLHAPPVRETWPYLLPVTTVGVCHAELTATVLGIGLNSVPAYALC